MAAHVIDSAISTLAEEANNYFQLTPGNELVIPANLLSQAGSLNSGLTGKIVLSLINIEEDRVSRSLDIYRKQPNGMVETVHPEVRLNLYLLFIASAGGNGTGADYTTSLENLSRLVAFFQTKGYFNHQNTPALDSRIEKLVLEMYSLSFEQQNHLWGALGAKYMPSVMYRARLVKVQEEEIAFDGPPITQIHIQGQDQSQ